MAMRGWCVDPHAPVDSASCCPSTPDALAIAIFTTLPFSPLRTSLLLLSLFLFLSFSCLLWQPSPRITAPRAAPTATATAEASAASAAATLLQASTRVALAAPRHYYPAAGIHILHSRTIRLSPRHPRCAGCPRPVPRSLFPFRPSLCCC